MWSPENSRKLASLPDFSALFHEPGSPVAERLANLERVCLDPSSQAQNQHDAAGFRAGILFVLDAVFAHADSNPDAAPPSTSRVVPRSRYLARNPT